MESCSFLLVVTVQYSSSSPFFILLNFLFPARHLPKPGSSPYSVLLLVSTLYFSPDLSGLKWQWPACNLPRASK